MVFFPVEIRALASVKVLRHGAAQIRHLRHQHIAIPAHVEIPLAAIADVIRGKVKQLIEVVRLRQINFVAAEKRVKHGLVCVRRLPETDHGVQHFVLTTVDVKRRRIHRKQHAEILFGPQQHSGPNQPLDARRNVRITLHVEVALDEILAQGLARRFGLEHIPLQRQRRRRQRIAEPAGKLSIRERPAHRVF